MSSWSRLAEIILGIVSVILSLIVLTEPGLAAMTLVFILCFAFLAIGLTGVAVGLARSDVAGWRRAVEAIFGAIVILLALVVLFDPVFGLSLLITLLGVALLVHGIRELASCFAGGPGWLRILRALGGGLNLVFALVVFAVPAVGFAILIILLSVSLLVNGIVRLALGTVGYSVTKSGK